MSERCRHLEQSSEAYEVEDDGRLTPCEGPMLCAWADNTAMIANMPRWLQRNALAGHQLRYPDDCNGCPCFDPLPTKEQRR